jgi:hypothetical protein
MNPVKGHYAVVQYCPDPSRLEAANIGVVLFCPSIGFLKARPARDEPLVTAAKEALVSRLDVDAASFRTVDDLADFANRRANDVRLTPLRSVQVADPQAELEALFERLAGERQAPRRTGSPKAMFGDSLKKAGLAHAVRHAIAVKVEALNREVKAPFGYKNGRFHLIEPVSFKSADSVFQTACTRAIEGGAVYACPDPQLGLLQMTVVGQFSADSRGQQGVVRKVLADHNVDFYPMDGLGPLLDDIRANAASNALQ